MPATNTRSCPACGTVMPASFPEGLCPRCLLAAAAPPEPDRTLPVAAPVSGAEAARPGGVPSVEMLRGLFPELEILDVLGAGGMGAVYKARQPRLNRLVALKIMVCPPGHETDFALRFEREAQVLARLNHPHIVILHDFGELGPERTGADPLFYFLMEHVDGTDLGQLIKSKELKPAQALAIVPQICEALQYAHDQGITHRDIKPGNILLDKRGVVKIADFGLAKMITGAEEALMTGLTQTGTAMGTPHYMAPEQWEHPEQVDHRADIYALGVVFYEMLTGERPAGVFEPPSRKTSPPVDRKLDKVVLRAMEKDRDRRYQQAGQIGDDVTRISGANKRRPATTGAPGSQRSLPKRLLALGALGLFGLGGWWMQRGAPVVDTPPAAFAPGQWINLDQRVLEQGDAKPATGGWLLLAKQGPQGGRIVLTKRTGRNAGLRGRFHGVDFKDMNAPYLRLRASDNEESSGGIQLHLDAENQVPTVWIKRFSTQDPNGADLLKRPLAAPLPLDREYTLELYLVGSQVIARCNQELFQVALDDESSDSGQASLIEHLGPDRFRDLEFINLDGLGEAEALKLAGLTSDAAPSWTPVWSDPHDMPNVGNIADGWALTKEGVPSSLLTRSPIVNGGLRARFRAGTKGPPPQLILREQGGNTGYNLIPAYGGLNFRRNDPDAPSRNVTLKKFETPLPAAGEEYMLAFFAVGRKLIARLNDKTFELNLDESAPEPLPGNMRLYQVNTNAFRDAEVLNLDGLSEAAALKLARVETSATKADAPPPTSKPGRLEGRGTLLGGKTLDLTRCAAFADFVDVAGGMDSWVALRANGETVSSDGKADFLGIRKIARSYQSYACFIDTAGGLRFHPAREMALPDSLTGGKVADAACGSHHGVALLEDGRAVVFGKRYEEAVDDVSQAQGSGTPRWPQPEAAALQNVKGVAVTQTHAATLHHDGTVSVWGWEGPVKWQPEPEMRPVRQISSFHDALHLLDEAGQVWSFPLPRSAHPQQPVGFTGRVKLLGKDAVRLRDHLWLNADGAWRAVAADRPTVETLESVTLRPETNFALLASASGAKPFGYALWIEPVDAPPTPLTATSVRPFVNSLGMKFVPVPIKGGPTDGQRVLFSIWETRLQDFQAFSRETKLSFSSERFAVGSDPTHPVATVTWDEAQAFCSWLTERERKDGKLGAGERYRLPSDHEWSCAIGIGEREDAALSPKEKSGKLLDVHPWGTAWPPAERSGNFASEELCPLLAEARYDYIKSVIPSYQDGHATLAPVGSYPANALGLYDLAGNVQEWCEDWLDSARDKRVDRGAGSWSSFERREMRSAWRGGMAPHGKVSNKGFRVVLAPSESAAASASPPVAEPAQTTHLGPSALPSAKPGRLRAAGTTANGKPHDLARFAAHDDFVDVAGGWSRWVALRANGETVSSDGRADFTGIARITASFNSLYAFITTTGKLVIPDYEKWTLPPELEQGVVDAALGMQHGIALLEGGRAVVFGARYEGVVGDPAQANGYGTPRWPAPGGRALEQVRAVAATVTHAATLHEDGTLSLWGWEGPLEWRADPRQWPLRQLRSTEDGFWALDEAGQLWFLHVPRNPSPGQPVHVTDKPSLSELGVTHLRPRCWRRKSGVWIAHMNTKEGNALMKDAGIAEHTAFSLNGGLYDGKPFASLLWIEPGE